MRNFANEMFEMLHRFIRIIRFTAFLAFLPAFLSAESRGCSDMPVVKSSASGAPEMTTQDKAPIGKGLVAGRIQFASPVMLLPVKHLPAGIAFLLSPSLVSHAGSPVPASDFSVLRASHRCTVLQVFRC
jgi:hypothetical protein